MRTGLCIGLLVLAGCDLLEDDCLEPLNDNFPASFAESGVFTECYIVSVCDDGAFDWYEPMSESGTFFQYDSEGQTTFVTVTSDADTGRACATSTSFGVGRPACTDRRVSRGCVVPDAPREPVVEPPRDLARALDTLEEARAVTACHAVASCTDAAGVLLEVRSQRLETGFWFEQPVAARSTLGVYEVESGSLRTTAHLAGPSFFAFESETGWLYWEGPPEPSCLDAAFVLTDACTGTLGVPDAIEALWQTSL
jgi:hypothetical protein